MRLFIAEKPSVAKAIAACLPGPQKKGDGAIECGNNIVTWCFGHLMEQVPPEAYGEAFRKWAWDTLPIVPKAWQLAVKPDAKKQFAAIKALLKTATEVVNAGDADREGEMLVREVLDACGYQGTLKRLWLSAMDDASVRKALAFLKDGHAFDGLYASAVARSRADWLVGMNLSRAYTLAARSAGHEGVISVGRVQTPTLALIVRRDAEIEDFRPRDYFTITASFRHANGNFAATWQAPESAPGVDEEGRLIDPGQAKSLVARVSGNPARIARYEQKAGKQAAPLPFALSTLQQACSAKFGMSAQTVLDIAQALYETHKIASYPRTNCGHLPESMHAEAPRVIEALLSMGFAAGADPALKSAAFDDKKISAHHGIIPTGITIDLAKLTDSERKVFDLIALHYLAQFHPDFTYQQTTVDVECAGEIFRASGRVTIDQGWKALLGQPDEEQEASELQSLPAMAEADPAQCTDANAEPKKTKAPARFTDGTLIAAMTNIHKFVTDPEIKKRLKEAQGIGTEATRAGIIETLLERKFIEKKGKHLMSTETGKAVVKALGNCDATDPGLTALFEQALAQVEAGSTSIEHFLQVQINRVTKQIELAKVAQFSPVESAHKCPQCAKPLRKRKGSKGFFWACSGYPECTYTATDEKGRPGKSHTKKAA